ncbi:MAG: methyl-accepting chemotaxis protein, partial [Gammaproteobacteria bacterium SHHR-1]
SKEISKVMEIINTVADQTKLIAFNAALEASSAGEAGRRFGVVAAEIRRLADNVTQSTGEIETKVNEIQDSIGRLVVTSEKGAKGIEEGMQASGRTAERLNGLVEDASQSADSAQQISLSTQQQKTASKQVVTALREIVSASSNTAEAIRRISTISREMATLSSSLKQEVEVFTLNSEAGEATPAANAGH